MLTYNVPDSVKAGDVLLDNTSTGWKLTLLKREQGVLLIRSEHRHVQLAKPGKPVPVTVEFDVWTLNEARSLGGIPNYVVAMTVSHDEMSRFLSDPAPRKKAYRKNAVRAGETVS